MKSTKNRFFLLFAALFLALTLACWFHSPRSESLTERRKLAQKPEPGFTVDGLEDEYKIFLVAGQYRDSISFDVYCQTLFALKKGGFGKRQREYEYKGSRYERALNYVEEAFKAFTADDE